MNYPKMEENDYRKLLFQTRGQFIAILNCFNCYGLEVYVQGAVDECMKVTENFGEIVRGSETPVHILSEPKPRAIE